MTGPAPSQPSLTSRMLVLCAGGLTDAGKLAVLRGAVQLVLDDDETGAGGWGPDVTMAEVLRTAMELTI
jgi:hypothetical protein